MNIPILASEIVRRVHKSPDSVTNLEAVVSKLIRLEQERDRLETQRNIDEAVRSGKFDAVRHRTED